MPIDARRRELFPPEEASALQMAEYQTVEGFRQPLRLEMPFEAVRQVGINNPLRSFHFFTAKEAAVMIMALVSAGMLKWSDALRNKKASPLPTGQGGHPSLQADFPGLRDRSADRPAPFFVVSSNLFPGGRSSSPNPPTVAVSFPCGLS